MSEKRPDRVCSIAKAFFDGMFNGIQKAREHGCDLSNVVKAIQSTAGTEISDEGTRIGYFVQCGNLPIFQMKMWMNFWMGSLVQGKFPNPGGDTTGPQPPCCIVRNGLIHNVARGCVLTPAVGARRTPRSVLCCLGHRGMEVLRTPTWWPTPKPSPPPSNLAYGKCSMCCIHRPCFPCLPTETQPPTKHSFVISNWMCHPG